jgi:hypothetical protein
MEKNTERANLNEAGEQLLGDLDHLREAITQRTGEIRDGVNAFVKERPITAVAIGFGVGWLLSGALYSRTTGRLLGLGTRFVLGALVKQAVAGGGLGALATLVPEREDVQH